MASQKKRNAAIKAQSESARLEEGQRLFQMAVSAYKVGNLKESDEVFNHLIESNPNNPVVYRTMGALRLEALKFDEALPYLKKALEINPNCPFTNHDYAVCLSNMGHADNAAQHIAIALQSEPSVSIFWSTKAGICFILNQDQEALLCARKALILNPNNQTAYATLINVLIRLEQYDEAAAAIRRLVQLKSATANMQSPEIATFPSKIIHDYEQIDYLLRKGKVGPEFEILRENLKSVMDKLSPQAIDKNKNEKYHLTDALKLLPTCANYVHIPEIKRVPGCTLNENLDFESLQDEYWDTDPHLIVIDDFLSQEALQQLRDYCLEATIWHKLYQNGYLGAMLLNGFGTELLFQISADIKRCFPRVFRDLQLMQSWCFKCTTDRPAINLHADFAEVNLNLWISPEDANLDKNSGGLVVYDKASPKNWRFSDYNSNQFKIKDFIEKSEAKAITIPYRENRIVIFDSALFHKSDEFKFKPGYENRRMNVTFLYGQQLKA